MFLSSLTDSEDRPRHRLAGGSQLGLNPHTHSVAVTQATEAHQLLCITTALLHTSSKHMRLQPTSNTPALLTTYSSNPASPACTKLIHQRRHQACDLLVQAQWDVLHKIPTVPLPPCTHATLFLSHHACQPHVYQCNIASRPPSRIRMDAIIAALVKG